MSQSNVAREEGPTWSRGRWGRDCRRWKGPKGRLRESSLSTACPERSNSWHCTARSDNTSTWSAAAAAAASATATAGRVNGTRHSCTAAVADVRLLNQWPPTTLRHRYDASTDPPRHRTYSSLRTFYFLSLFRESVTLLSPNERFWKQCLSVWWCLCAPKASGDK